VTRTSLAARRLLVRADATQASGTGHLMRCLALAQAWIDLGGEVRWWLASAPEPLVRRLRAEGIRIAPVEVEAAGREDGRRLLAGLASDPEAVAVIDGYAFGTGFLATLAPAARRVLVVDDMAGLADYPFGWVLNQNAHADRGTYPADSAARFLLGLRYLLLRREFRAPALPRPVPLRADRLLVTFGGADPTGMTLRTVHALRGMPDVRAEGLEVRLVVGAANTATAEIVREAAVPGPGPRFDVRHDVPDMSAEIRWADMALTSGGSTVWELARYGCPALVVETVPAETRLVEGLRRVGLFDALGPETGLDGGKIEHAVTDRLSDPAWRERMAAQGRRLVDGGGALRVARALAGMDEEG